MLMNSHGLGGEAILIKFDFFAVLFFVALDLDLIACLSIFSILTPRLLH